MACRSRRPPSSPSAGGATGSGKVAPHRQYHHRTFVRQTFSPLQKEFVTGVLASLERVNTVSAARRAGLAAHAPRLPLARRGHRRGEGHPRQRPAFSARIWSASSTSARSRRARTCRASRRPSTTRSARRCWASRCSGRRRSRERIAETVRERQDALRAEVTIAARYPEHKPAPVSGILTQEIYTLFGARGRRANRARAGSSASPPRA